MYIQLSEKQQLALARRLEKYSEIKGERKKMTIQRNFSQGCISPVFTMEKKYTELQEKLKVCINL